MVVGFTVLAHYTLALLSALDAGPETVAIVFPTFWFFARTPPLWDEGRDSLEGARVPEVGNLLGFVYMELAVLLVATIVALASLIAEPPFGEALAVHFEAVDLGALAALRRVLAGGEVHMRNGAQYMLIIWKFRVVLDQKVEEVLARPHFESLLLQFVVVYQLQWPWRWGRVLGPDF